MNATVVGGGLAGCEAAWALAERGIDVTLFEMRPTRGTAAHQTDRLGEIVCMQVAESVRIPGGAALTVDRERFSEGVTAAIDAHPRITIVREEVADIPSPGIVATGPLTSDALADAITARLGVERLAFYDAIAPIVSDESLDHAPLYRMSRYGKGDGDDFLNVPLSKEAYDTFLSLLQTADQHTAHEFDAVPYFEGCLPIEEMASRGVETLRFGPLKPVGLPDPRTGRPPHAVVQLRREDRAGQMWNLVGFQTRLRIPEQRRVFRSLPGLERAEFYRYGSIHRNTYLNTPASLTAHLALRDDPHALFAGQLIGVEGYTESLATGLLAGINLARLLSGEEAVVPPPETMLGALLAYVHTCDPKHFQPMNANFGLLPPLERTIRDKRQRREALVDRAVSAMDAFASATVGVAA